MSICCARVFLWFYCVHLARRWKPVHDGKVEESTQLSLYSSQFRATSKFAQKLFVLQIGKSTVRILGER